MCFNDIVKGYVSALLAASIAFSACPVFAGEEDAVIFKEDYQNIPVGGKPAYGAAGWTGDTSASHGECTIGVVNEHGNKSFLMQYVGEGKSLNADPLIYRNISVSRGETHMFTTRLKTDDANRYKRLFLRAANSAQIELFSFTGPKVRVVGSDMADIKKGKWYEVKVIIDGTKKTADVYVDGVYGGTCFLSSYDLTNMSIRVTMMGSVTAGVSTNVYIDNTAYAGENIKISFAEPEYIEDVSEQGNSEPYTENKEISVFAVDNTKAYIMGEYVDTGLKTTVYRGNTVIPLRNIARACGTAAEWNAQKCCAELEIDGRKIEVTNDLIKINGVSRELSSKPYNIAGSFYLDMENTSLITGKNAAADLSGAVYIYDESPKSGEVETILEELIFTEPTAEEILADFSTYNKKTSHPRLLMDKTRLEKIKNYIKTDATFKKWYETVKAKADKALTAKISEYELRDGERLLYVSRDASDNIIYPALAYLIEGDSRYFDRAVAEMLAVSQFKDWHPTHFLDTAEMTLAVAIGYDWLYDSLSKKQRDTIANAILRLGLDAARTAYDGTAEYDNSMFGSYHNRIGWKADPSNWGLVCNGGIAAGALTLMGDYETEYCAEIVSEALRSIETPLRLFSPDGAWSEGLGYWGYACNYLAYMLSSLKNTLGTNYDYTMVPGLLATAFYPTYLIGPTAIFNYGDATETGMSAPVLFWFAKELGEPALNASKLGLMERFGYNGDIYDIIFYDPELPAADSETEKDKKFRIVETAVSTNSSASTNANYLAIKGGVIGESHGDLDGGSFVLDAIGQRWALDLGSDSYTLPGYFEWPHRGDYYRKRAEGHSTLVIDPDGGLDQRLGAKLTINRMTADTYGACSVMDLSAAYSDKASSVQRAAAIFDNRSRFMIKDEVKAEKPVDVYWFMQTSKEISVADDGKSLILSDGNALSNGKRMKMILQSSCADAVFTYGPAEPLEISPQGEGQTKNQSVKRIAVKSPGVTDLNMQVIFIPYILDEGCDDSDLPELMTIDDLVSGRNVDFGSPVYAELKDLTVNGKTVSFFDPTLKYYTVRFDADYNDTPVIGAASDYDISIIQPESVNDMAKIYVSDPKGRMKPQTYYVSFEKNRLTDMINADMQEIRVSGVEASATTEEQNKPENTIDNDPQTKWSANGKQWIRYDLGIERKIDAVGILWMDPTDRTESYSVEISSDGVTWVQLFNGRSLGTKDGMEYVLTDGINARYVRLSVNGTTAGTWTSLMETKIFAE